jgi:hypothetical protein
MRLGKAAKKVWVSSLSPRTRLSYPLAFDVILPRRLHGDCLFLMRGLTRSTEPQRERSADS